ncbi:MAG: type II secretion system inner membrane protein GspF [Pseudomonadota bacterium]
MPAFEYEALDAAGKRARGLLSADSESAARRQLRRRQLAPLKLTAVDPRSTGSNGEADAGFFSGLFSGPRLPDSVLTAITRQLATLVDAGMPIAEAVAMIAEQGDEPAARRILLNVRGRITEGERLSDAMTAYPDSFPAVYRAMIAAGESSGGLAAVLERLADYLEKSAALKQRIGVALIYPGALAAVAIAVVGILMVFIVPRIAEQFTSMGVELPAITRIMIATSGFLQVSWLWLLLGLAGLVLIGLQLSRRAAVKAMLDRFMLAMPVLGGFIRKIESARFARTMGILIASGAVLTDALASARRAAGNAVFKARLQTAIEEVETGRGLSDALNATRWFPPLMLYMTAAGERSGRLDEMFERSANSLEAEVDASLSGALALLEPGVIIVMGAIVATIILSILLPILQLNTMALG